nr:nucleotide sugar dehydrogenase [Tissierella sp.]
MENKKLCVVGLGYIGLPTSAMFATHGYQVHGVDLNEKVVDALNEGKIVIEEPYLDILVQAAVRSEHLKADTKPCEADAFIIAVPTPMTEDKSADMSYVISAAEMILPYLKEGNVVILESTSPTGTVENILVPILEKSGLKIGEELFVGHSPERVLPGKILWELVNNDRIVGGINRISAEKIRDIYRIFVNGEIFLTTATTAEMCKMMENTYRDVNIALANELAKICEKTGINAWDVINLANKHPRVNLHQPGPGVGGHCLAVDPWFIVEKNPELAHIIKLSRETNEGMPEFVVEKIKTIVKGIKKPKIAILGVTYKPNIDDMRESPIMEIVHLLKEEGVEVSIFEPHVEIEEFKDMSLLEVCRDSDLAVLAVNHDAFNDLPFADIKRVMKNGNILDTRNFLDGDSLKSLGFNYYLLGNGGN